jgi:hypothetical protein
VPVTENPLDVKSSAEVCPMPMDVKFIWLAASVTVPPVWVQEKSE